jgi:hypothetical protein
MKASVLKSSGLTAGVIKKFRLRGGTKTIQQTFLNFEAGLKAVSYTAAGSATTDLTVFSQRNADAYTTPGTQVFKNMDSWTELELSTDFTWDGVKNIEVSVYHSTASTALKPSDYGMYYGRSTEYGDGNQWRYMSSSTAPAAPGWTANAGTSFGYSISNAGTYGSDKLPSIEFDVAGCGSTKFNLASCYSVESCSECIEDRSDCVWYDNGRGGSCDTSANGNPVLTTCPPLCSSYKECHVCRNETDRCFWFQ